MAIIEFEDVGYTYANGTRALDGVSLSIEEGEFTCILGCNGSGKSTLARHMNGLLAPTEGTVRIDGMPTSDRKTLAHTRCLVGMVFQNPDDQIVATVVEDDVAFGPENLGLEPDEVRRRVDEALGRVGLTDLSRSPSHALSGGQKQRVAIAGALAMHPRVLVLDEAGSMIDPQGREELGQVCEQLHSEGITIVSVTHSAETAAQADRVIVLDRGRIALDGPPDQVLVRVEELEGLGVGTPYAVQLAQALRQRGVDVNAHIDLDSLANEIAVYAKQDNR